MNRVHTATQAAAARAPRGRAAGFTLLETVVALLVMMIVGLAATSLFFYAIRYNTGAAERSMALAVAQQQMEKLRALPFDDAQLDATAGTTICNTSAPCYSAGRPFGATKVVTESTPVTVNGVTTNSMKTITITVTPIRSGIPWTAGAVSVTALRATLLRGPN
ncbi:MAG TPA: prepilin-type N-terminal cleavage/methylation domain-containing protein [Pyrinomonadaceae bacterium]|jgi:Tfp pilus assembly protein PilV